MHGGSTVHAALTGGFDQAFWVLGAIALIAVPAVFALIRRDERSTPVAQTTTAEAAPYTRRVIPVTTHARPRALA
jgi:hypothetical protein